MADCIENERRDFKNILCVRKLPRNVVAKQIENLFKPFGLIVNLYLKRRTSKESNVYLENPYVVIVFENQQVIDEIMASRPFYLDEQQLLVRRFLPQPLRPAYEPNYVAKKALVRVDHRHRQEILPENQLIIEYLQRFGGQILYSERLDDQTFLVQFDDYDPVDLTYLYQPHFINGQSILIEKCLNENQVREQIAARQKIGDDVRHSFSPVPLLSFEEQKQDLMGEFNGKISEFERTHEENLRQLKDEYRSIVEERIRFQRLTADYEHERDRLLDENRTWQKLYSESLQEKPKVQHDGEEKLKEIREKILTLKTI